MVAPISSVSSAPHLDSPAAPLADAAPGASAVSDRKRAANRANAARSTGPKTDAGKAWSSVNAVRHGLLAETSLMPGEDAAEQEALRDQFTGDYAPVGPVESLLVDRLVGLAWKLRRLAATEETIAWERIDHRRQHWDRKVEIAEMFGKDAAAAGPEPDAQSTAGQILADDIKSDGSGRLQQLGNHEIRLTGQLLSTVRQLSKLREVRMKADREAARERDGESATVPSRRNRGGHSRMATDGLAPDAPEFAWEVEQRRAAERAEDEAARRVDAEAWQRAIELARAEGESAGRAAAIAELKAAQTDAPSQEASGSSRRTAQTPALTETTQRAAPNKATDSTTEPAAAGTEGKPASRDTGVSPVPKALDMK